MIVSTLGYLKKLNSNLYFIRNVTVIPFFLIEQENVSEPELFTGTTPRSLHRDLFHFENVIFLKKQDFKHSVIRE